MMKKENEFILELCKFKDFNKGKIIEILSDNINYPYVLGQILWNRIGSVAYYVFLKCEILSKLNREFRNPLKSIYFADKLKTESYIKCLDEIAEISKEMDFNHAWLKGTKLVNLYPKGLRISNDFDVLMKADDVTKMSNLLKSRGFKQGYIRNDEFKLADRRTILSSKLNRGETVPFVKKVNLPLMKYIEIDVNFSLDYKPENGSDAVGKMLENITNEKIKTLSQTDFLLHLCTHLYKEATVYNWVEMGRDLSLYKFVDIYLFITELVNVQFAKELIERIVELELNKPCYFAFYNTKTLFNIENENLNNILNAIKPVNIEFMNTIINPSSGQKYRYDMDFKDWVFENKRKNILHEITNETA